MGLVLPRWSLRRDTTAVLLTTATFSFVLGVSSVAVPLLAIQSGYSVAEVGVLAAVSAVSPILIRLFLNRILRVFPN